MEREVCWTMEDVARVYGKKEDKVKQGEIDTLREHAATADLYAYRAEHGKPDSTFLGKPADYWRGAADTYRLIAQAHEEG